MPRSAPHFKLLASIKNHRKANGLYEDKRLLGIYVSVGLECVERFGDRTSDSFLISGTGLCEVTGARQTSTAVKLMRSLAKVCPISIKPLEEMWLVEFPNFSKKQGFKQQNGALTVEEGGPSASAPSSATATATQDMITPPAKPADAAPTEDPKAALEKKPPGPDPFAADTSEAGFCNVFDQRLKAVNGKLYRSPGETARKTWVTQARLLLKEAGKDEVRRVATWLFEAPEGDFWRGVIFSVPKFREKFLQLAAHSKREAPMSAIDRNLAEIHAAYDEVPDADDP